MGLPYEVNDLKNKKWDINEEEDMRLKEDTR